MPKITVTNTKGLVQESGTGGIKVVHSSVSGSAGVEGLRVAAGGASGFLHMVQAPAVTLGTATVTTVQALIPAAIDNSDSAASVVITHDNLMAGPVGCTINLLCATAATTEG